MLTNALERSINLFFFTRRITECPKIYRKSVLLCLSITQIYTEADAVHICGKFWDTQ